MALNRTMQEPAPKLPDDAAPKDSALPNDASPPRKPAMPSELPSAFAPASELYSEHHGEHHILRIELLISNILRIGVAVSISLVVLGIIVTFARHSNYNSSADALKELTKPGAQFPHTIGSVIRDLTHLEGRAIVMLGLLCLIATPVLRVAISIYAFVLAKDRVFVIVTSIVLLLLLLSFFLGKVE